MTNLDLVNDWGDLIAHQALQWNGKEYRPGVKEQCMAWVRKVLEQVQSPFAARVTGSPVDKHWTGPSLASSLAGRDLGQMVTSISELERGDIIVWNDTYDVGREFGPSTITHVGISLGPERFIHRNTMSAPVNIQPFAGMWRSNFRAATRLPQQVKAQPGVKAPDEHALIKVFANLNGGTAVIRQPLDRGWYRLWSTGSADDGGWLVKLVAQTDKAASEGPTSRLWVGNGATLELRHDLDPGSYAVISAGSEQGGALLLKFARR